MKLSSGLLRTRTAEKPFPLVMQPKQQQLLDSQAFLTIYGGQAGGGKSFGIMGGLLSLSMRYRRFNGLAFRKTLVDAKQPGALWPLLTEMAAQAGYITNGTALTASSKDNGSLVKVSHLQRPDSRYRHQGTSYDVVAFDEGTHFSGEEAVYLISRLRNPDSDMPDSATRMWITCNPSPTSFLRTWLAPWVVPEHDLYPAGENDTLYMRLGETPEDVTHWAERQDEDDMSIRFIPSELSDNKYLGEDYRRNLERLTRVEKQQLLYGSWNEVQGKGQYFATDDLPTTKEELVTGKMVRAYDTNASLSASADYTAGVLMRHDIPTDRVQVQHVTRYRASAAELEERIVAQARIDGPQVVVSIETEPASQAAAWADALKARLQRQGIKCHPVRVRRDKGSRVLRLAASAQQGRVTLLEGQWNAAYRNELVSFPEGHHDDQVDASSLAYNYLVPVHGAGPTIISSGRYGG